MMYFNTIMNIPESLNIDNPYYVHQFVALLFDGGCQEKTRNYLYRLDWCDSQPVIYAISPIKPSALVVDITCEEYKPKFEAGEQIKFDLRVNPVITKQNQTGSKCRHDIVMEAKARMRESGGGIPKSMDAIIREEGIKWLETRAERLGFAFNPDSLWIGNYQRQAFYKHHKGEKLITFSTLDYSGTLTVTDPETFIQIIYSGIGHSKGFGCGLLMVRKKKQSLKSFQKMYFITLHAVNRYREMSGCTARQAMDNILTMMQTAEEIKQLQDGKIFCMGSIKGCQYGIVTAKSDDPDRWDAVVTVLRAGSYEEIKAYIKR